MEFVRTNRIEYGPRKAKNIRFLQSFIDSGIAYAEVRDFESHYASVYSCSATLQKAVKAMGVDHIRVITRRGKLYLINELVDQEDEAE